MWRHFVAAIQFLTIIPCGKTQDFDARGTMVFFPVCGLLIGAILMLVDTVAGNFWDSSAVAVIGVVTLAAISGALHLDGLADTADGLYGSRAPEKALAIMKDSRIGAMGMVVVTCCLAIKWAGLAGIDSHRLIWLLLIPGFARASVLFGIRLLPYGRPHGGTGQTFFQKPLRLRDFWGWALLMALAVLFTGWGVVWVGAGAVVLIAGLLTYFKHKINCITGDMLGAMIEITEAGLFLLIAAAY